MNLHPEIRLVRRQNSSRLQRFGGSSKQRYTPRLVRGFVATLTENSQSPNIGFRVARQEVVPLQLTGNKPILWICGLLLTIST